MYNDINTEDLQKLYKQVRKMERSHKIVHSVFYGSSVLNQLSVLKNYQNDIEICISIYKKELSLWDRKLDEVGELSEN